MAKYRVRYYECYEGYYEVENAPEECYDSDATVTEILSE